MKKTLLSICILIFAGDLFSQTTCPTQFAMSHVNASACGSRIRLYFASCPTSAPTLDSIKVRAVLQPETFTVLSSQCDGNNNYVDYCISDDNLVIANRIKVFLTYHNQLTGAPVASSVCEINIASISPVVLTNFGIQRGRDNNVAITWQTEQEMNSSRFEIERSYSNNSFESVGTVSAAGFSATVKSYTFSDKSNDSHGVSFYRIKMIDKDGSFTYTDAKSVKEAIVKAGMILFPNPCHGTARITVTNSNEPMDIHVTDVSGRLIRTIALGNGGTAEISNLQIGNYFVRVNGRVSGSTDVKKLSVID